MPLSEHEQRLLDQIERQLYAEDPKFASAVRSHDVKSHLSRRVKRYCLLLGLGLGALVAGAVIPSPYVGVAGFLIMLVAGFVIARSLQRLSRGETLPKTAAKAAKARRKSRGGGGASSSGGSFRERAEERFRRRFEDPDR